MTVDATAAFLDAQEEINKVLSRLARHCDRDFGVAASDINWGHVSTLREIRNRLLDIAAFAICDSLPVTEGQPVSPLAAAFTSTSLTGLKDETSGAIDHGAVAKEGLDINELVIFLADVTQHLGKVVKPGFGVAFTHGADGKDTLIGLKSLAAT